ncbi:MAG: peptidoglycan DD-metalloendopeptidase family protein [Abditibacteriota bacterium]|nr:peptidoglycan DD-metalloendopeptidase family protein [Abditibacteriota bacterium]
MKKIIPLVLIFILAFSSFAYGAHSAKENKKANLKQKLSTLNQQMKQQRSKIAKKKAEKKEAYGDLHSIDSQIDRYQSRIAQSQIQISKYQNEIDDIDKNLAMIEQNLNRREELLRKRVVDMYKGGDLQFINVLLNTTDMWSFLTQSYYIKKLINYDSNLINQIKKDKAIAKEKRNKRKLKLEALKGKKNELIVLRNKQNELASNKKKEIEAIENDLEREEAAYRERQRASSAIESQILAMQATPQGRARLSRAFTGSLSLPVAGRITSNFGYRIHPIKKTRRLHTGVDLAAPSGTPIHCAGSGVVIKAGWNNVYGNCIIVDHGGGVTTLYGHCSSLLVHNGQSVSKGQVIGKVGSTGWSTGPHCHYEKRVNGKPVNPL